MPDKLAVLQAVIFIALLCAASVTDLTKRIVPNWLCLGIAGVSIIGFTPVKLLGILIALPFLLAAVFFGGMGGGDIKLTAAAGFVLGFPAGIAGQIFGLTAAVLYYLAIKGIRTLKGLETPSASKFAMPMAPFLSAGFIAAYILNFGGLIL